MKVKECEKLVAKSVVKANYRNPEACKKELNKVLKTYNGLAPELDQHVFDNGDTRTMLCLKGTIPITYKANSYNIPVSFWLPIDYPKGAPLGYVQPTADMSLKASPNVDNNGRIRLPYLEEWTCPDSNLGELVQLCTLVFGKSPPVFAKTKNGSSSEIIESVVEIREAPVVKASLVTALSEKLRPRFEETYQRTSAECESLFFTHKDLLDGQERLNEALADLEAKTRALAGPMESLRVHQRDLKAQQELLSDLSQSTVDPESVFEAASPGHAQLVNAYATDAAIDDTLYALGNGLQHGQIEFQDYLKKVRQLSRKQFQQRFILAGGHGLAPLRSASESRLQRSWSAVSNPH
eukprot:snap_masked-scaffold19_size710362-processed-gene-1.3 protein:Tk00399 transcript:snap_masked-scaffold19_size710362-processed-gene-1.3-mRNA-1 annotation:"tumor susceptibility gene 101 protein isoform x2"